MWFLERRIFLCTAFLFNFITEVECVYCAVRTESLTTLKVHFVFKGRAVARPFSCVPFNVDAWVRYHVNLSKICGEQVVVGQLFLQVLVFSRWYHFTNTHYSSTSTCNNLLLPEGKRGEALQPSIKRYYFGNRGALDIKVLISSLKGKLSYTNQIRVGAWLGLILRYITELSVATRGFT